MRIKVLGPLEVAVDGESLALGGPQQRLVLAALVSRADSPVTTESLIEALWPDQSPPDRARKTVQVYVANLRKALGGQHAPIESATGGYVLRTGAASVDAVDFEAAVSPRGAGFDPDAKETVERLSGALALWNGPPYADLGDAPALTAEITRLDELRLVALERRLEASLTLGHHREELSALDTLTTDHPYRERFTALQMLALYRSGRQAEALRAYQRTRLVLGGELGIDPSPELQALEQAILMQDASLDLPEPSATSRLTSAEFAADTSAIRGYELREQLGETAEAALWRAYQPATGREVTLRIFGPEVANEPRFVKRFESEAHRLAQTEHPHLISIYDFWRDPDGAYVVMPLLRGGTLADSLQRGRWKLSAALRMLDQVGSALATLHRHGLEHGGLGPESVFLDADSNTYLADAGITGRVDSTGSDVGDLAELLALTVAPDDVTSDLAAALDRAHDHERVEDLLRAVRQAMGSDAVGVASDLATESGAARNPYKGLRAFQETDAADFFGREVLVSRLVETVAERPLTAVVGSSGSGKSSVVKAGLIPAVKGGALGGDWLVTEMFPGTFPFEELEAALLRVAVDRPDGLMADLTADDRGMLRVIKRVLPDDGTGLLLVIDQFEELFSLTPDEDTRHLFVDNLVTLGSDARSRVRVVVTMRADFFDRPLDHPAFAEMVQRGLVTVAMPDQDSLALMVSQPARQSGLELEPGLVTEVVRDVMEQPGGLPLMQYALTELAERSDARMLTVDGYRESGGVLGALGQRAEEIYEGLQPSARQLAERIFLRLVAVDEHSDDTRRRIRRAELTTLGFDRSAVDAVLQEFGSFRLLSFDHDPTTRGPTVEVAHEALIREWPRLRSWVDDQRESLLLERRLREAVVEWECNGRDPGYLLRGGRLEQFEAWAVAMPAHVTDDERRLIEESRAAANAEDDAERRRVRRLRRLVAAVGVALVAALIAGALALREQARAEDAAEEAEQATALAVSERDRAEDAAEEAQLQRDRAEAATAEEELATLISRSAALATEDPDVSLLLALEAHQRAPTVDSEAAVLSAVTSSARVASLPPLTDPSAECFLPRISGDGLAETAIIDGRLVRRDLTTGEVTDHGAAPTDCGSWIGDPAADQAVVETADGMQHWLGPFDGPLDGVRFGLPSYLQSNQFRPNHRLVYSLDGPRGPVLSLRDDRTGEQVGGLVAPAPTSDPDFFSYPISGTSTADGSRYAFGFAVLRDPGGEDGRTFMVDGNTGQEIFVHRSDWPAERLVFDEESGQLVAWMLDGTIRTIDSESGEEVRGLRTGTTATSQPVALGIRDDGVVIAVSESQVEFLDRSLGTVRNPVTVQNVRDAWIRPDGTVTIETADGSIEWIDPESNALIGENAWDVDPTAHPAYKAGLAAALETPETGSPSDEEAVVVDLSTGRSTTYKLLTDTGQPFEAVKVYPEPDGVWAFSDFTMARWRGEEMVAEHQLGGYHILRTQFGDLIAVLVEQADGSVVAQLWRTEPEPERLFSRAVEAGPPNYWGEVHPSLDGGLHVIEPDGTLKTYDSSGRPIGQVETGVEKIGFIAVDPTTGKVALVAAPRDLLIVDPKTEEVDHALDVGRVGRISTLGFGRDGELLVLTYLDGRVRLWDIERGQFAGQVWSGTGQGNTGSPSWYDDTTETMWVASSGKYLGIPLNSEEWFERACEIVSRELTQDEWDALVPGDEPPRSPCN